MGRKKNETRDAARVGAGEGIPTEEERREEDHGSERGTQRERERKEARVFPRRESYNSTKHNPRVNLTSPPCKSELDQRRKGRVGRERRTGRERGIRYG